MTSIPGGIDDAATVDQIQHIVTLIPDESLESSATGPARQSVDRTRQEFGHGVDAVVLHGAASDELDPVVAEYRATDT